MPRKLTANNSHSGTSLSWLIVALQYMFFVFLFLISFYLDGFDSFAFVFRWLNPDNEGGWH